MQGVKRKLVYVTAYEIIGMAISALGLALLSGHAPSSTGPLAVVITTIAVSWNFIYNSLFEWWESRQASRTRTLKRRILHAVGFQLTLVVYLIPLIAWWMGITLWQALLLDMALIVIIPCYTFLFNWAFDKLFGLPASALPASALPAGESA
ncbi:TPA: PACE efflux transporter [Serratia marcescens]|nr:PACE efflux transporter [Serratia marcescens]HAT4511092.1 PACE efflux transporter [Serratia marcescens]HAT4535586.1 PACE efflux transporter [Serratia marcescens]